MKQPIIIIGIGEMGGIFAQGFLRLGRPVIPVLRGTDFQEVSRHVQEPEMVLLAVAEKDFHAALDLIPQVWRARLALLQNELLPRDWEMHGVMNPTVMAVWFEKKKGRGVRVLLPTQVYGEQALLVRDALDSLSIPVNVLSSQEALEFELVVKNLFVVTINIAGLQVGGTTGALWAEHQEFARKVAAEVLDIQEKLIGKEFDRNRLMERFVAALESDPEHTCRGRAAPDRLARAIVHADASGLKVPSLRSIRKSLSITS